EDVQTTDVEANSGVQSLYFLGQSGGGPQDVILDFGQQYNDGIFTFESAFFIKAGKTGYFNFQATSTPGTVWAMNCNFSNGEIRIDDGGSDLAVGSYTEEQWVTLRIEANLSTGRWQGYTDGECFGVWANSINEIASLDLFPLESGEFFVDDVMYDHASYTPADLNASIAGFNLGGRIAGTFKSPTVTVTNAGSDPITSFDVSIDIYGSTYTESVTGVNLISGQTYDVVYSTPLQIFSGIHNATATVSNVNGGNDGDATDDDACLVVDHVTPAPGKVVVGEEATGTWCPWCVRGTVFMDRYENEFSEFWAGIAVHNGDPMVVSDYDSSLGAFIAGYPSAVVDRGADIDPSSMGGDFYERLQTAPTALISNVSSWDAQTRELQVTVEADFQSAADNNWKLACVLTEDGVTGTDSGYDQANAYAGGGNGEMGGYELLPSPVPAADMVYDHVARAIEPSFDGDPNSFPATVNAGEQHSVTFTFTLPAEWNENKIHVIGMLIDNNGRIDNAGKSTVFSNTGIQELTNASFRMYPNPSNEFAFIEASFDNSEVSVVMIDMAGKEVASRNYGIVSAGAKLPINTMSLESGVYLVNLSIDGIMLTQRLIVE
ncbi:Omp28-related outer membrane protein, partial [Crocinitomicaceae bacterium]|nr:Omp28-related outer membrane protein [Crocinitomicaceae bacterium]